MINSTPSGLFLLIRFDPQVATRGYRNSNPSGLGCHTELKNILKILKS